MEQIDFSNIELSIYEKFVLGILPILKSSAWHRKETIAILYKYGLIKRTGVTRRGNIEYKRTHAGKMYFRIKRKDSIRFLVPVIISVIALLAAYDVMYIQPLAELLQELSILLKNIAENLGAFHKSFF